MEALAIYVPRRCHTWSDCARSESCLLYQFSIFLIDYSHWMIFIKIMEAPLRLQRSGDLSAALLLNLVVAIRIPHVSLPQQFSKFTYTADSKKRLTLKPHYKHERKKKGRA